MGVYCRRFSPSLGESHGHCSLTGLKKTQRLRFSLPLSQLFLRNDPHRTSVTSSDTFPWHRRASGFVSVTHRWATRFVIRVFTPFFPDFTTRGGRWEDLGLWLWQLGKSKAFVGRQSVSEVSIRSVFLEDDELGPKKQNKPKNRFIQASYVVMRKRLLCSMSLQRLAPNDITVVRWQMDVLR